MFWLLFRYFRSIFGPFVENVGAPPLFRRKPRLLRYPQHPGSTHTKLAACRRIFATFPSPRQFSRHFGVLGAHRLTDSLFRLVPRDFKPFRTCCTVSQRYFVCRLHFSSLGAENSNSCALDASFVPIRALEDSRHSETRFPSIQKVFAAVLRFLITLCTFLPILRFFEIQHPIPCGLTNSSMRNPHRRIGIGFVPFWQQLDQQLRSFRVWTIFIRIFNIAYVQHIPSSPFLLSNPKSTIPFDSDAFSKPRTVQFRLSACEDSFPTIPLVFGHVFRSPAPVFKPGRLPTVRPTTQFFSLNATSFSSFYFFIFTIPPLRGGRQAAVGKETARR